MMAKLYLARCKLLWAILRFFCRGGLRGLSGLVLLARIFVLCGWEAMLAILADMPSMRQRLN
jgi:hypothetical protein